MAAPHDLITLARAANRLQVPLSDIELPGLITTASEALAEWVGYPLHLRENVVETCAGGAPRLFLQAGAIRRVLSVHVFGVEVEATGYKLEDPIKGHLLRLRCDWPFTGRTGGGVSDAPLQRQDTGDIAVTFDAGWVTPGQVELARAADPTSTLVTDLPATFEEAALVALTAWYRQLGADPDVTSMSIGGGSVGWGADSMRGGRPSLSLRARAMVARYRRHGRGTP